TMTPNTTHISRSVATIPAVESGINGASTYSRSSDRLNTNSVVIAPMATTNESAPAAIVNTNRVSDGVRTASAKSISIQNACVNRKLGAATRTSRGEAPNQAISITSRTDGPRIRNSPARASLAVISAFVSIGRVSQNASAPTTGSS